MLTQTTYLESEKKLGPVVQNVALLLEKNAKRFANLTVYQERVGNEYRGITWSELYEDVLNISFNLQRFGFSQRDKVIIYSPNRLEMLEAELAIMASGGISAPIYAYYKPSIAGHLIRHSDARFVIAAGLPQLGNLDPELPIERIFTFDDITDARHSNLTSFRELLKERTDPNHSLSLDTPADEVCLNMFTSGTMAIPKCVQLTHSNILSQQAALSQIWDLDETDRFLSYLPWHHSFGGIFERFSALYSGATLSLESGYGKDPKVIFENWKLVQPTVFFSVPKVYQALIELTQHNAAAEKILFNSGLKFVFTAAAPLPPWLCEEFTKRGVKVLEGWGLTETAPCCTLTDPDLKREPGIVGKPIPGVSIRIAPDGEIEVHGPNVMKGYYKNPEANEKAFTGDGWFRTGDVGEITQAGLKLISRKDRIFKLVNGEKVIPSEVELVLQGQCHYILYAIVVGSGREHPVALLFPNKKMLEQPAYELSPEEGCFCPRNLEEFGRCLRGCLRSANKCIGEKFSRIKAAMIIDDELSVEKNTLTPSMKITPNNIIKTYKAHLENLYGAGHALDEEVYVISLE